MSLEGSPKRRCCNPAIYCQFEWMCSGEWVFRLWIRAVKEIVKWIVDSTSKLQEQRGFTESWKLCLNLCSLKWLNPRRSLVTNFSSFGLLQLKTLFAFGLMKLKIFFLKSVKLLTFQTLESSLFHSITEDEKHEFLKKLCLMLKYGTSSVFLVL